MWTIFLTFSPCRDYESENTSTLSEWFFILLACAIVLPISILLYYYATPILIAKLKGNSLFRLIMSILEPIGIILVIGVLAGLVWRAVNSLRARD